MLLLVDELKWALSDPPAALRSPTSGLHCSYVGLVAAGTDAPRRFAPPYGEGCKFGGLGFGRWLKG